MMQGFAIIGVVATVLIAAGAFVGFVALLVFIQETKERLKSLEKKTDGI